MSMLELSGNWFSAWMRFYATSKDYNTLRGRQTDFRITA